MLNSKKIREVNGLFFNVLDIDESNVEDFDNQRISNFLFHKEDDIRCMYQISDELYALKILNHFIQVESAESRSNLCFEDFDEINIGIYQNTNEKFRSLIELRNEAYGKTLVLKNNRNEFINYRITQANRGCINKDLGVIIINRLSPLAKDLAPAGLKDSVYLEDHGECEVIGISLLERDYQIYNQDNFKSIKYFDQDLNQYITSVFNLKESLTAWKDKSLDYLKLGIDLKDKYNELINRPISISPDSIAELGRGFYTSTTKEQEDMMQNRNYGCIG